MYLHRLRNGRLGLCEAVWLQAKVRDRGLDLRPRLYAGPVRDDSTAETAYSAVVVLYK